MIRPRCTGRRACGCRGWPVWLWRRCFCRSYRYSGQEVWMDARVRSGCFNPYAAVSSRRCQGQRAVGRRHETLAGGQAASRNPRHLPKPRQSIRVHSWRPDRQIGAGTECSVPPTGRGLPNDSRACCTGQYRNPYCSHPSLSPAGVGYRGLVIGKRRASSPSPDYFGRRGRDLQQLAGWRNWLGAGQQWDVAFLGGGILGGHESDTCWHGMLRWKPAPGPYRKQR